MQTIVAADIATYLAHLATDYPGFELIKKSGASRRCMTWSTTIYVPSFWDQLDPSMQYVRLCHEQVHLRQFKRYGIFGFSLRYFLPPVGLAYGRFTLEKEAFAAEMQSVAEVYGIDILRGKRQHYIDQFTTGFYWYAWPFFSMAERWVDHVIAVISISQSS